MDRLANLSLEPLSKRMSTLNSSSCCSWFLLCNVRRWFKVFKIDVEVAFQPVLSLSCDLNCTCSISLRNSNFSWLISQHSSYWMLQTSNLLLIKNSKIELCVVCWEKFSFKELLSCLTNRFINDVLIKVNSSDVVPALEHSNWWNWKRYTHSLSNLISYVFENELATIFSCILWNSC